MERTVFTWGKKKDEWGWGLFMNPTLRQPVGCIFWRTYMPAYLTYWSSRLGVSYEKNRVKEGLPTGARPIVRVQDWNPTKRSTGHLSKWDEIDLFYDAFQYLFYVNVLPDSPPNHWYAAISVDPASAASPNFSVFRRFSFDFLNPCLPSNFALLPACAVLSPSAGLGTDRSPANTNHVPVGLRLPLDRICVSVSIFVYFALYACFYASISTLRSS